MYLSLADFRKRVEFSLCRHHASDDDVRSFCAKALSVRVGVVCINPVNIPLTVELLEGKGIEISANIGFPFGSHLPEVKALETRRAVQAGATQIDMVINVGALRSKKNDVVLEDIQRVAEAAQGRIVKTIIETWVLTDEEKERACRIAEKAGAALVKTTTGVRTQYLLEMTSDPRGAVLDDIRLMRRVLSPEIRIKASGGIYTLDFALELIRVGADQLGMSQGERIIREFRETYGEGLELN
jgi:deoxyribose-phosphate aldolase